MSNTNALIFSSLLLAFSACKTYLGQADKESGGGSGGVIPTYTVGGTVSGLSGGTLVLQNNGGDDLTITSDGSFTFATALPSGSVYEVTVLANPTGQVCMADNSAGTIAWANVTDVVVHCATDTAWYQDAYIKASNTGVATDTGFGDDVAISGSTIVVGAYLEDSNQTWITNSNGSASSNTSAGDAGAVYVFQRDTTGTHCTIPLGDSGCWYQDAYLKPSSDIDSDDHFGRSVAISGVTIVVGAPYEDADQTTITNANDLSSTNESAEESGAAYVFQRDTTGAHCAIPPGESWCWYQDAYLKPANAETGDYFGYSVAISGNVVVVGALYDDSNQTWISNANGSASANNGSLNSGALFVFVRDTMGTHCAIPPGESWCWYQDAYLKISNSQANYHVGAAVAISGWTIVAGVYAEDSNQTMISNANGSASSNTSVVDSGAVYVFQRDTTGTHCTIPPGESWCWYQDAYLKASNAEANDFFGFAVAISGPTIVVGAIQEDSDHTAVVNPNGSASSNNFASDAGAVYVFQRDTTGTHCSIPSGESWCWYQDAYLKPSNTSADDHFGYSVAISGSTIVVGAYREDSDQTMVTNPNGSASTDNSATNSGAVYVFQRAANGDWYQDAYLKASNAEAGDEFGRSVAISGTTIVVGTLAEDSNQTSITNNNSQPTTDNNLAADTGAVYVFRAF